MNSKLNRRLQLLEKRLTSGPIILQMPDGRTELLRGRGDYTSHLFARALGGDRTPEIELIAQSISSSEPGDGRLIELARAILNSPE